jgi:RNA polymerase subunit RPABC4/transcription elongation factor Spt4
MTQIDNKRNKGLCCSNCGGIVEEGDEYCTNCGAYILAEGVEVPCKVCGAPVRGNFCPKCGSKLQVSEEKKKRLIGWGRRAFASLGKLIVRIIEGFVNLVSYVIDEILRGL